MTTRREILSGAIFALLPTLTRKAAADTSAGNVVGLRGQCTVAREGTPTPLKLGDAVMVSDTIDVPADGKLKLRMSDGSVVSLASGTRMTLAAYQTDGGGHRQNAQLSLAQGLVRAVVAPVDHPANFDVATAVGTAAVRSTDWFIAALPGSAQVGVLTGKVDLTSAATGRTVTIPSHWGARLEAGRDPVEPREWSAAEFQAFITRTDVP
jgi:hypothetical protein